MTVTATGRCLCGSAGYEVSGAVQFAIRCHCRDCQRISGGGHLPQIGVAVQRFSTHGTISTYTKPSDAGNDVALAFCSACGSALFKTTSKMPDVRFLCAGSLEDDLVTDPFQSVFEEGRRCWDI